MKKNTLLISIMFLLVILGFIISILFLVVMYPIRYKDTIYKYASVYDIEPEVVCAIINIESGFNSNAVSKVGAIGLMQLMPDTASEIAQKLNIDNYTVEMLYSPEINIRFGCFYLRYLLNMYDGNMINAVSSYNAGFNKVNEWLKNDKYAKEGTIVNPPVSETKYYLRKFENNVSVYETRL